MMSEKLLELFDKEMKTAYRDEIYLVRDNGAVCRERRPGKRKRPLDDIWTFGNPSASTGYMTIGSEVAHRIVATAFHGEQPTEDHIVDHVDTNRRNNRSENLRWLTRLENILLNPATVRRIEITYGSLDAFFHDPACVKNEDTIKRFEWMRTVTKQEAEESLHRIQAWMESGELPKGGTLGDWIFGNQGKALPSLEPVGDIDSLTPLARQRNWKTPSEFPACPKEIGEDAISAYGEHLQLGAVFSRNEYSLSTAVIAQSSGDGSALSILSNLGDNSVKAWAVAKVTLEKERFVHESIQSFFTLQGAIKGYCKILGMPWDDSIDDYC